ncbi:MAG: signal peptidase I [Ruminococcus sp.]|nr:signal peptidase I [Ruminococcus sp.]
MGKHSASGNNKKRVFRVFNIIKSVASWTLIVVLTIAVLGLFVSKLNGEIPSVFGYSIYRVSSGSMEPELMTGDIILSKQIGDTSEIKKGDVITFVGSGNYEGLLVTHEVIKEPYQGENGRLMLQTKGVANEIADAPIYTDDVVSVVICKLTFLNTIYELFFSPWGLLVFIAVVLLIFLDEIIRFVRVLSGNEKSAKKGEDVNKIIERLQKESAEEKAEKAKEE